MAYIGKQPTKAALTASDIEDGIITAAKIEDGAVVAAEIASNAVTTAKINADAVTSAKIADNAVVTAAINADAITGAKIADDAINSEHYTDGSIDTAHLADGQVTTAKLATAVFTGATDIGADLADADLILVDDGAGGTIRKAALSRIKTYAGGTNTPIFHGQMSSAENVSDNSFTKASFQTEVIDTASAFASSRFTVPSGQGGRYFIYGQIRCQVDTDGHLQDAYCLIYKNGSAYQERRINFNNNQIRQVSVNVSAVVDLAATDYVELYGAVNTTSSQASFQDSDKNTFFGGYKLIE